jgi:hypothetical protein
VIAVISSSGNMGCQKYESNREAMIYYLLGVSCLGEEAYKVPSLNVADSSLHQASHLRVTGIEDRQVLTWMFLLLSLSVLQ